MSAWGDTMKDDEERISAEYRLSALDLLMASAPFCFAETKWVVAAAAVVIIFQLTRLDARLHDLCVTHRRTNLLMSTSNEQRLP